MSQNQPEVKKKTSRAKAQDDFSMVEVKESNNTVSIVPKVGKNKQKYLVIK